MCRTLLSTPTKNYLSRITRKPINDGSRQNIIGTTVVITLVCKITGTMYLALQQAGQAGRQR